jgi:hypothetical protein
LLLWFCFGFNFVLLSFMPFALVTMIWSITRTTRQNRRSWMTPRLKYASSFASSIGTFTCHSSKWALSVTQLSHSRQQMSAQCYIVVTQ